MRRHWWLKKYDNIYILWKSLKVHNPYPNPCVSQIENFSDFRKEKQWIYYLFHAPNRGLGQPPTIKHINIFFSGKHEGLKQNYLMLVQKVNLHYSCLFPSFVEFGNVDEGLWRISEGCSDLFTEQTFILYIADGIGEQGFFWTHEFYSCNYNQNVNRLWIDFRMLITLRGFIIGKVDTWKFSFVWKSTFKQLLTLSLWLLFIIHVIHVQGK